MSFIASDHASRAYIARTLGDLLEDTDPCEAVEYVIPLLTGLALDEGKSIMTLPACSSQLTEVWQFQTSLSRKRSLRNCTGSCGISSR
jgi:hypothetical protein